MVCSKLGFDGTSPVDRESERADDSRTGASGRQGLFLTTALCGMLALMCVSGPAQAQSVTTTGNLTPSFSGPVGSVTMGLDLAVGDTSAGSLFIANGGWVENQSAFVGSGAGAGGSSVTVSGSNSRWINNGNLNVGHNSTGTLTITGGGAVTSNVSIIGRGLGASGSSVLVSGADGAGTVSSWTNSGDLTIGNIGDASMTIEGGGRVSNVTGVIANGAGVAGSSVSVSGTSATGSASTWSNSGNVFLGRTGTATLTIADGGKVEVGNNLGGPGLIHLAFFAGSEGILNIGAQSGSAAAGAGTLEAAFMYLLDGAGTVNFNHTGSTVFSTELISIGTGTHALNHIAGVTTLTGDSSFFTGTTTVSGGTLLVGNALGQGNLSGVVQVNAGGTLGGSGRVGSAGSAVTIAAGGVHAPGNSIGVQNIAGNYVNNGILRIEATPAAADRIVVAGTVDISGATLDLVLSPNTFTSWSLFNGPYTIIDKTSAGAVTGSFVTPYLQNLLFLDAIVAYDGGDGNDVTLELRRNTADFSSVGRTPNQIATATAIETLGSANPIWGAIALIADQDTARASFDALSGEVHASARTALIEESRFIRGAINDRIRAAFGDVAAPAVPVLAYGPGSPPMPVLADDAGPVFWGRGFGSWGSTDSDGNAASLDRDTGGLLIGTDRMVGDWRVGLLAGYSRSSFTVKDRSSSGSSDNYHLGVYGGSSWGDIALRTGAAYSWHHIETARSVAVPGVVDSLSASYRAGTFQAFGELGYGIEAGNGLRFEPFANLAHVSLHTNGFGEAGGDAALGGRGSGTDVTFTTLGLRGDHVMSLGSMQARLRGLLGWRHAFGDTVPQSTLAFSTGSSFVIAGAPIAADSAVVEVGLDLDLTADASFGLSYSGQLSGSARDHGFQADLSVRF